MNDVHKLTQNTYDKIAEKYHQRYGEYSEFFLKFSKEFMKLLPKKASVLLEIKYPKEFTEKIAEL